MIKMDIRTVIKEISVIDHILNLSVEVICDHYRPGLRTPRIEIVFDNGEDSRRMVMHVLTFGTDEKDETAAAYSSFQYFMEDIFWDSSWNDCRLWLDVEYDGVIYSHVPLETEACEAGRKNVLTFMGDHYRLHFPEGVDSSYKMELDIAASLIAIMVHLVNALIGIILLPWFCLDTLVMLLLGTEYVEGNVGGSFLKRYIFYVSWRYFGFGRNRKGVAGMKINILQLTYQLLSAFRRKKTSLLFLSSRRKDLTGNFEYVYDYLKDDPALKIRFWLHPEEIRVMSLPAILELAVKASGAKVILIDDYVLFLENMGISRKTKVMQLWHACGAFKTFGFSRTGKKGGPLQKAVTHRNYSYAFVSSANVAKYYAEGFGIAEKKVIPCGIPRTDMFFDEQVRAEKRDRLFSEYPVLKDKKVILFAPTFRGDGKQTAYYEKNRFDPDRLMDGLSEEYVLIIKHHPFVKLKYKTEERNRDRIFDFSGKSEINDLLFITDLLITDYSSVIYEASILNIPMLFYAYDLENYIATRDFYSGYEHFVPGRIVQTQEELLEAIRSEDYEQEKVEAFCRKNFDIRDGKASSRVAAFIKEQML